ncbi:MAG: diguanylate cyclase, partial [Mycobacteriales bacterium]
PFEATPERKEVRLKIDARKAPAGTLRELGHVVAEAADCSEALGWMSTWPPDVVLVERVLPDGDGMSLVARLQGDTLTRDVPVVLVTSPDDRDFVVEALRRGAHDYLVKPFVAEDLLARTHAALRTKALVDELRGHAAHDSLTGLHNPRGVAEQLSTWRAHCTRHAAPLTVVMLDVDDFTQVNAQHSYAAGDRVLRAVAEQLQACVRTEDLVGRWGGDEFVVLLPRADADTAAVLVARVNARLSAQQLLPDRTVSLQAGVAVLAPGDPEDDEHLFGRATISLRQARGIAQPA